MAVFEPNNSINFSIDGGYEQETIDAGLPKIKTFYAHPRANLYSCKLLELSF
jgi:hypothetical protein